MLWISGPKKHLAGVTTEQAKELLKDLALDDDNENILDSDNIYKFKVQLITDVGFKINIPVRLNVRKKNSGVSLVTRINFIAPVIYGFVFLTILYLFLFKFLISLYVMGIMSVILIIYIVRSYFAVYSMCRDELNDITERG